MKHKDAANEAIAILNSANSDPAQHPYALNKSVPLGDKVKRGAWPQRNWADTLLIPIYQADGQLSTLEAINSDGEKDYLKGGRKCGGFHPFGKIRGAKRILIGEGLATVAAVYAVANTPAVAAMDAGNLVTAAQAVRSLAHDAEIIFLADNDIKPNGDNPGLKAATAAALSVGGRVAVAELNGQKCDFWDVWRELGATAVSDALKNAIQPDAIFDSTKDATDNYRHWSEPQPLTATIKPEAYPIDALPEVIRDAVAEVQEFVKAPFPLVATTALSALSLACQAHVDIKRAEKLTGPASLFLLTIADSGERKTTCDGFFTSAIRQYETEQAELIAPLLKDYAADMAAWNAQREGILSAIKDAGRKGKDVATLREDLRQLERYKPESPKIPKLILGDETPENLAYTLAKGWPTAGVVSSEAGVIFGAHGMGKDCVMRNLGLLNVLWDGGSLSIGRRSSESFTVQGARLTVGLQIQEATLKAFFDKSGSLARGTGFLARFLVAWPESTQGWRLFTEPPENWPKLAVFHQKIKSILETPMALTDAGLEPVMLGFTASAKAAWIAFHNAIEVDLRASGELYDVRDVASKTADNAARLAALFHVFIYGVVGAVDEESFVGASRIAAWHLSESRRFFGELALPEELANAARLDAWLIEYSQRERTFVIPRREVQRSGPVRNKDALKQGLQELEELDRVRLVIESRRKEIHINPALLAGGDDGAL